MGLDMTKIALLACLVAVGCVALDFEDQDRIIFPKKLVRLTREKQFNKQKKEDDRIVFPGQEVTTKASPSVIERHSEDEMNCFKKKMVFYKDDCYELLTRGPCRDGEWLVLDIAKVPEIQPKCEKRKCSSTSDYVYVQNKGCVFLNNQTVCTKPRTGLYSDPFGLGTCDCMRNAPNAMYKDEACYLLYTRGPCEEGYIFVEKPNLETECQRNQCHRKNGTFLFWEKTKKCYRVDTQGPCGEKELFQVGIKSRKPSCSVVLNEWHLIDLPNPNCDNFDQDGKCVDGVSVAPQGEEYLAQLLLSGKKRKKRLA